MLKFVHRCTRIPLGLDLEGITILSLTIEMFTSGNFSKYSTFVQRQCRFKVGLHDNDVLQIIFVVLLVCVSWKTIEKRCAKFYDQLLCNSGMTKYRKGPQRTTKDRKGPTKDRKGPQRTHKRPTKDRKGALRAKLQEIGTN